MAKAIPVTINGITYRSVRHACETLGLNHKTITLRIKRGMSREDAILSSDLREGRKVAVTVDGVRYSSNKEACTELGLNYATVRYRLGVGWSVEDAFSKPVRTVKTKKTDLKRS